MVEAAMGVVGVEMVEAPGRVEEPATAPVLLAALAPAGPVMEPAGLVMGPVETVMEPAIAPAPPMPPLLRLMPPLPLRQMPLRQMPLPPQPTLLLLTLLPPWITRP